MRVKSNVEELKPTVDALAVLGFLLVKWQGPVATFQKEKTTFSIVKDRGSWFLSGEDEELRRSPSRKSRAMVTRDAIAWIKKKNA